MLWGVELDAEVLPKFRGLLRRERIGSKRPEPADATEVHNVSRRISEDSRMKLHAREEDLAPAHPLFPPSLPVGIKLRCLLGRDELRAGA